MHKYTEAAVKIQTRYRAYKSTSLTSPNIYQYRGGGVCSSGHLKLKNQFLHHSSIDETALNDCIDTENDDDSLNEDKKRRLINSDLQLNQNMSHLQSPHHASSKYQDLPNQKRIARKLMNIRQSPRFSPAAASTPLPPMGSTSTLITKSQTSINSSNVVVSSSNLASTNNNGNNNIIFDPVSIQSPNNSQLHHHHHHHHHFHHHFHNKNATESQQQQNTTGMIDSSQPVYLRRKTSDIQAPNIINTNQFASATHLLLENQNVDDSVLLGLSNINNPPSNNSNNEINLVDTNTDSILGIKSINSEPTVFDLGDADMNTSSEFDQSKKASPLIMTSSTNTFLNSNVSSAQANFVNLNSRIYPNSEIGNSGTGKTFNSNTGR